MTDFFTLNLLWFDVMRQKTWFKSSLNTSSVDISTYLPFYMLKLLPLLAVNQQWHFDLSDTEDDSWMKSINKKNPAWQHLPAQQTERLEKKLLQLLDLNSPPLRFHQARQEQAAQETCQTAGLGALGWCHTQVSQEVEGSPHHRREETPVVDQFHRPAVSLLAPRCL